MGVWGKGNGFVEDYMGCDIHSVAIDANGKPINGGKWADGKSANPDHEWLDGEGEPFGWRNYGVFGFLAGVRNYSGVTPISEPRGLPDDLEPGASDDYWEDECWLGDHSHSWLSVAELAAFDYDKMMVYRRGTEHFFRADGSYAGSNGGLTLPENVGKAMTYRDFIGEDFFRDLAELRRIGADRVVFGFDN